MLSKKLKMACIIPFPNNPEHVENLRSIPLLEAQGFVGADASLAESLFCYKLAWRLVDEHYIFIHGHAHFPSLSTGASPGRQVYDLTTLRADTDPQREWRWVNWVALACTCDLSEGLADQPLPRLVGDLIGYYGVGNIFGGAPQWDGFTIEE